MNYDEAMEKVLVYLNGLLDGNLRQAFISAKQGRLATSYYWYPLSQIDRGFQGRKYNVKDNDAGHTEHQIIEQPIKIMSYVADPLKEKTTAFNLSEKARMIVNSLPFIEHLKKMGIEVTRPSQLTALKIVNDSDNYEDEVSFQFSIIYTRSIKFNTGVIVENEIETHLINN